MDKERKKRERVSLRRKSIKVRNKKINIIISKGKKMRLEEITKKEK
jgi:hypothetical protein